MTEKLSALLDGDLDDQMSAVTLDAIRRDEALQRKWQTYCLVGDALRGESEGSLDFTQKVMAGLDQEPTVLSPARIAPVNRTWVQSMMPIAASVMGVVAVGWVAASLSSQPQGGVSLASSAQPPRVETVAIRPVATAPVDALASPVSRQDAHREYLFVHQAMNGGGMIPGAVHYVRTVADSREDQRR